jgi:hypothetical protein
MPMRLSFAYLICALTYCAVWLPAWAQAQAPADDVHEAGEEASDWANNWAESWRTRLEKRENRLQRLFNWQINENTLLSFYGQLNVMYLDYDDGIESNTFVRDNANSPGRLGLRLESDLDNGNGLFFNFETGLRRKEYNSSFGTGPSGETTDWSRTLIRKAEVRVSVPDIGFFSFGQGSMAADGITGFDFSNTTITANSRVGDTASGELARFTNGIESNRGLEIFFPTFDGSRRFRARYDSLANEGLSWSVSFGREVLRDDNDNTYADAALRYETQRRQFRVKTGIAYAFNDSSPDYFSGSVSGIHDQTGLNFALAAGADGDDGLYAYGKFGIIRDFFFWGRTSFSVDYYVSEDPVTGASGSRSWGLAVVQDIEVNQTQLYATYREYSIDGTTFQFQDVNVFGTGVRFTW